MSRPSSVASTPTRGRPRGFVDAMTRVLRTHGGPLKPAAIRDEILKREARGRKPTVVLTQVYNTASKRPHEFVRGPEGISLK